MTLGQILAKTLSDPLVALPIWESLWRMHQDNPPAPSLCIRAAMR